MCNGEEKCKDLKNKLQASTIKKGNTRWGSMCPWWAVVAAVTVAAGNPW